MKNNEQPINQFSQSEIISGGWRDYLTELAYIAYAFKKEKRVLKKYREREATQNDPALEDEKFLDRINRMDEKIKEINDLISGAEGYEDEKKEEIIKKTFEAVDILMEGEGKEERDATKANIRSQCDMLMGNRF